MLGELDVSLSPRAAVDAGAQWRIAGSADSWRDSGTSVSLTSGTHTIEFYDNLYGWGAPPRQTVTVATNEVVRVNATYTNLIGQVEVFLSPRGAINDGAKWRIAGSGGPWRDIGTSVSLTSGTHTIEFYDNLYGWDAPPRQTVTVVANEVAQANATYANLMGSLEVFLSPQAA